MAELLIRGRKAYSIFDLLGANENDMTYSVAWVVAQSPRFARGLVERLVGERFDPDELVIELQRHERDRGFTDIEMSIPGIVHLIVEAKRGWHLPGAEQLRKYARRDSFRKNSTPQKRLIALTNCRREYAQHRFQTYGKIGAEAEAVSWAEVFTIAEVARRRGTHAEKRLIGELLAYLKGVVSMQQKDSNWVYVVAVAGGTQKGWSISWIDIVEKKGRSFHPLSAGWPKEPPNYLGFRYRGQLQSIHHVEAHEVTDDLHAHIPEIAASPRAPHILYTLGPPIRPTHRVVTGKVYPSGRVWCMIDTLLTSKSISDARDLSQRREQQA